MKKYSPLFFPYLLLSLVTLIVIGIRIRLLHLPLDRDEGEYAYAGWRMIHGGVPFLDYYNMKMPGIYAFYGLLFLVFSPTVTTVRLGLLLVNLGNAALMFQVGKKLENTRLGIYSSICYLIFSLQLEFQGMNAYAEHFSVLFVLAGIVFFLSISVKRRSVYCFFSGLMLGVAFLMKQPSFALIPFGSLLLTTEGVRQKTKPRIFFKISGLFALGAALPLLVTTLILYYHGAFHNFILFAFKYARSYASYINWYYGLQNCIGVLKDAIKPNIILWILIPASVITIFTARKNNYFFFKIPFVIFSFIAVSAGFYFRPHYFQFVVPAISLLAATALISWEDLFKTKIYRHLSIAFVTIASVYFFWNQRLYFFSVNEQTFIRENYHFDLFNAAEKVGDFIAQNSKPDATVAIFGAEPEILFYSKRKGATGFMYVYPLMEDHKYADTMLSKFYDEIIKSKPDILVYTSIHGTWHASEKKRLSIFNWYKAYRDENFRCIGLVEMLSDSVTNYYLTGDTAFHPANPNIYVEIDARR